MSLGWPELLLLLVLILVLFGAGRLPQVMEQLGAGVKKFRESAEVGPDGKPTTPPKAIEADAKVHEAIELSKSEKQASE